jgi:hypothetical protein
VTIIISVFVSLATGVVVGYVFFRQQKREKYLMHHTTETEIISANKGLPRNLEISFENETIQNLHATRIDFWNAGNETILGKEIVSSDPLGITIPAKQIVLNTTIQKITHKRIAPTISMTQSILEVGFEILEPRDGFSLQLLHSIEKNTEDSKSFSIVGSIAGIKKVGAIEKTIIAHSATFGAYILLACMALVLLSIAGFLLYDVSRSAVFIVNEGWASFWERRSDDTTTDNQTFGMSLILIPFIFGFALFFGFLGKLDAAVNKMRSGRDKPPHELADDK